jgi:hypothetical protein
MIGKEDLPSPIDSDSGAFHFRRHESSSVGKHRRGRSVHLVDESTCEWELAEQTHTFYWITVPF